MKSGERLESAHSKPINSEPMVSAIIPHIVDHQASGTTQKKP